MYIGISLLYRYKNLETTTGVLKSYVVDCNSATFFETVKKKSEEEILKYDELEYLGLEDAYIVSGSLQEGEMLGRITDYDKVIINKDDFITEDNQYSCATQKIKDVNYFNCSLVYLHKDEKAPEHNCTLTIFTLIKTNTLEEAKVKANSLARDSSFLNKIKETSIENIDLGKIKFIGFDDFSIVTEDVEQGGAYQVLYNDEFETTDKLKQILPTKDELLEILNDLFLNENLITQK